MYFAYSRAESVKTRQKICTIEIWLSFTDTTLNTSCKVINYIVKTKFHKPELSSEKILVLDHTRLYQCKINKNGRDWHILAGNDQRIILHNVNRQFCFAQPRQKPFG